ncbi:MAG: sodium:proton antiporter NhaD [Bacteroidales bacterium]|nr:sodium:proton antiporter NhaD [Bacteroidales bacterium]
MFTLMFIVFVVGYLLIVLEHIVKINKAASALLLGIVTWTIYMLGGTEILSLGFSKSWNEFSTQISSSPNIETIRHFISEHELPHHLAEIMGIVLFLLGAMTIVEVIDKYQGFRTITERIKTTNKVKLLWVVSFLTFFLSAILDNLTTTIVMVALMRKILTDKHNRWLFAGLIVIAANAGGAWSPIGDVTTIMLWIGGQITAGSIIKSIFLPSFVSMIVPLILLSLFIKGKIEKPDLTEEESREFIPKRDRITILIAGILALISVPVFKTFTHLPPYMGMLLGLGFLWFYTDIRFFFSNRKDLRKLSVNRIIKDVDTPTILFFLGILSGVAALQSAGHLDILSGWLAEKIGNIYIINVIVGLVSSIVDNVPLVAASIGMYDIAQPDAVGYAADFVQNGNFWSFLAYCAGTGGSVLIIGSAAGVAAMSLEKIDFFWYLKHIAWLALAGYLSGALTFWLTTIL